MALGSSEESFSVGEIVNFSEEIIKNTPCVCSATIQNCQFWLDVRNMIKEKHNIDFMTHPESFSLKPSEMARNLSFLSNMFIKSRDEQWLKNTKILYDAVFEISKAKVIVDSSKDVCRALMLRSLLKGYKTKFIHLVRDCRGSIQALKKSTASVYYPNSNVVRAVLSKKPTPPEETIKLWIKGNLKITLLLSFFVRYSNWRIVKYEDYCDKPNEVFSSLSEWLGLSDYRKMVNFGSIVHHNVAGNRSRFNTSKIMPSNKQWKNELTEEDRKLFNKKANFFNRLYGYKK